MRIITRTHQRPLAAVAVALTAALSACSGGSSSSDGARSSTSTSALSTTTIPPVTKDRVSLGGEARLDGRSFDADFIGAVVVDAGLATPCNVTIPAIVGGRYALDVFGSRELLGCGRPGAKVVLWTYSGGTKLFSTQAIDWPTGGEADTAVDFAKSQPRGAAPTVLELSGAVRRADGTRIPAGARVDAYIGTTLCGVAAVRAGVFDGYILHVVGPDSIPGCRAGGTVTFRVDGAPVSETIVNRSPGPRGFDLTLR